MFLYTYSAHIICCICLTFRFFLLFPFVTGGYNSVSSTEQPLQPPRVDSLDDSSDPDKIIKGGNGVKITDADFGKLKRSNLWAKMPASTYGTCVHSCLTDDDRDFTHDISVLLVPMIATVLLQFCILWNLYHNLQISPDYTCTNDAPLVAVSYFLLLNNVCTSIGNVMVEYSAIRYCKHYIVNSTMTVYQVAMKNPVKVMIAYFTIFCEIFVTIATCVIGIWYINEQAGVRFIILSSVSVLFITNIDDLIFSNMLPAAYKAEVDDYCFDIRDLPSNEKAIIKYILHRENGEDAKFGKLRHKNMIRFQLYYQTLFYIFISVFVVYAVRYYTCGFSQNFVTGTDDMGTATPTIDGEKRFLQTTFGV